MDTNGTKGAVERRSTLLVLAGRLAFFSVMLVLVAAPGGNAWLALVVALAFGLTIPAALRIRRDVEEDVWLPSAIAFDLLVIAALVVLTGGISSPLNLLMPIIIAVTGLIASPRHVVHVALLATVMYLLIGVASYHGWIAHKGVEGPRVLAYLPIHTAALAGTGLVALVMARRRWQSHAREKAMKDAQHEFLKEWPSAFLFVDDEGTIALANAKACQFLGHSTAKELLGRRVQTILDPDGPEQLPEPGSLSERCFLRADGSKVQCSVEVLSVRWPSALTPPTGAAMRDGIVRLVWIHSPSGVFSGKVRPPSSADVAAEIAHEIRNPVAAISGCVQVLLDLERRAMLGDARSARLLQSDRTALFESIVTESARLDRILEKFIDYAEFSAARLAVVLNWDDHGRQPDTPLRAPEPPATLEKR